MTTATKEKAEKKKADVEKPAEVKPEANETKPKKEDFKVRHLTDEEHKELMGDDSVPEGFIGKPVEVKEEAAEEKPEEKEPEKTAEKPEEKKPEPAKEVKKDFFERVETELAKPENKEDLTDFTPREKAYFYQMRRDRKLRQKAEEERDQALFRETKLKEEKKPEKPEEEEWLKDRDPEEFLTVKEAREIIAKTQKKPAEDRTDNEDQELRQIQFNYLRMCEREAKRDRQDFDAVMELADELISKDSTALNEVSTRTRKGENPAVVMYDVIKTHKDFEILYPAAEIRAKAKKEAAGKKDIPGTSSSVPAPTPEEKAKEEKAKQAEKALEENLNKPKTTAHVSSLESKPAEEMTLEEIARMGDLEFAKLPKSVRQRYLKKYGA